MAAAASPVFELCAGNFMANMIPFKLGGEQKESAIVIGGRIVTVLLGWILLIQPAAGKTAYLQKSVSSERERARLIGEISSLEANQKEFGGVLLTVKDRHVILGKISSLANEKQLDVQSLTPTSSESQGPYVMLNVQVRARATFYSLLQFFEAMEQSESIGVLTQANLQNLSQFEYSEQATRTTLLQADLKIETFLRRI